MSIPILLIAFLAGASIDRWVRGKAWIEPTPWVPWLALAGAAIGVTALVLALLLASPLLEALTARSIEWTQTAAIRGNAVMLGTAALLVAAQAVATELVCRRWLVDRVYDLGARPIVGVLCGALLEGAISGGSLAARAGAVIAGLGYGFLYVGAGRRLAPAIACRLAFEVGALTLVGLRVV